MSATHFDADDAREDRARELREARERRRNGDAVPAVSVEEALTPPAPTRAPAIVPTPIRAKITVSRPMSPGGLVTEPAPADAKIGAFEVVTELPPRPKRRLKPVPPARQEMIDFCLQRIGVWVKYTPTPDQDKLGSTALASHVKKSTGGFVDGFEYSSRDGQNFFRFNGVES